MHVALLPDLVKTRALLVNLCCLRLLGRKASKMACCDAVPKGPGYHQ